MLSMSEPGTPFLSPHSLIALRISLLRMSARCLSFLWRSMNLSRTMPLTRPMADRTATVPRMFSASVMAFPTSPAGMTSP